MKKQLPTNAITDELAGASAFFQPQATPSPAQPEGTESPTSAPQEAPFPEIEESKQDVQPSSLTSLRHDVMIDVTTTIFEDVDLKRWREQIEDTETQNSSLRLTSQERYVIEDLISELRRKEKIKTSLNEVARLGLLFLIHEFKKHRKQSIIYKVKKA